MIGIFLFIICLEGLYICLKFDEKEEKKGATDRRKINGDFKNPLGDSYRKNTKGHLVPIKPNSKMLDGDEEDEV